MTRMLPRLAAGLAMTGALAAGLGACGGHAEHGAGAGADGGADAGAAPTRAATAAEFCRAWADALTELATLGTAEPGEKAWERVRGLLRDLDETGPPEELSADAREGMAVFTDALVALDHEDVARLQDATDLPGVTDEQEAQALAFTDESAQLCGKLG